MFQVGGAWKCQLKAGGPQMITGHNQTSIMYATGHRIPSNYIIPSPSGWVLWLQEWAANVDFHIS